MNKEVYVYGLGEFYNRNKTEIQNSFDVCGYIDSDNNKKQIEGTKVIHDIMDNNCTIEANYVLLMIEKPQFIFEVLHYLKKCRVPSNLILLGISFFGVLSKYYSFYLTNEMDIVVQSDNSIMVATDYGQFTKIIKANMQQIVCQRGAGFKRSLHELYKDELSVMWIDKKLWCADHDADIYYRFEETGFYNWGYALIFSMIALNHFFEPNVLDLGCGDAFWFRTIYKNIEGIMYTGCDFDKENIEGNIKRCYGESNARFINCDIREDIPYSQNGKSFDVVLWMESYCVFSDANRERILKEVKKRLGNEGLLFVCDFFSSDRQSSWTYSNNSANNKQILINDFKNIFDNVSVYIDERAEFFCLFASEQELPVQF